MSKKDIVLEIGPGKGALTKELVEKAKKVIAIEKDSRMAEYLKDIPNLEVIYGDVLKIKLDLIFNKVVANIPFYITGPIIRLFLESENPPKQLTLIIQKEVAQRICDKKKSSILSLSVWFYADAKIISYISKKAFSPIPKVDSAIIQITPKKKYDINPDKFFKIIKAGFSHPRKQLINNLSKNLDMNKEELEFLKKVRAEDLSIDNWISLVSRF